MKEIFFFWIKKNLIVFCTRTFIEFYCSVSIFFVCLFISELIYINCHCTTYSRLQSTLISFTELQLFFFGKNLLFIFQKVLKLIKFVLHIYIFKMTIIQELFMHIKLGCIYKTHYIFTDKMANCSLKQLEI